INGYVSKYQAKKTDTLQQAAAVLLSSVDHIKQYPSVAHDTGSEERTGKHAAQRALNLISGNTEFQVNTMIMALHCRADTTVDSTNSDQTTAANSWKDIEECLDFMCNTDNHYNKDRVKPHDCGGVFVRTLPDGTKVFCSQMEHYIHRSEDFWRFTLVEYETLTELADDTEHGSEAPGNLSQRSPAGRHKRRTFQLAESHPLFPHYEVVLRSKFLYPLYGGSIP
ncbi:unnamed protein product, partial [Heterosigma akashiwo]